VGVMAKREVPSAAGSRTRVMQSVTSQFTDYMTRTDSFLLHEIFTDNRNSQSTISI
jgi:hypothetical protein